MYFCSPAVYFFLYYYIIIIIKLDHIILSFSILMATNNKRIDVK